MIPVSKLARVAALALLTVAAGLSLAQTSASSPAKKELVQKVLTLQQPAIENIGAQIAANTVQQMLGAAGQAMGQVPADRRELVGNEIKAEAKKLFDDMNGMLRSAAVKAAPGTIGAALEERMSEDELKTLVAWLESPVSKKFAQLSGDSTQALGKKVMEDTRGAVEPKVRALDQSISRKLGLPAPTGASGPKAAASGPKK